MQNLEIIGTMVNDRLRSKSFHIENGMLCGNTVSNFITVELEAKRHTYVIKQNGKEVANKYSISEAVESIIEAVNHV